MASKVFSGTNNFTYRNETPENVRVVINFMRSKREETTVLNRLGRPVSGRRTYKETLSVNWGPAGVSYDSEDNPADGAQIEGTVARTLSIGRNIAFVQSITLRTEGTRQVALSSNNAVLQSDASLNPSLTQGQGDIDEKDITFACPTEIMLGKNEVFSAICGIYNIVIIPENG